MYKNHTTVSTANPWVRCFQPRPTASVRLFCFPYAGGAASIYRAWSQQLPATVEVCAIQLPGRESRISERPFTNLVELTQVLLVQLQPFLDKPFAFFGHSMGTLIAYELAQQLYRQTGLLPSHLLVSGRRAPFLPELEPLLHTLPTDDAFLTELQRRYNNVPAVLFDDAELKKLFTPLLRADLELVETYVCKAPTPLPCPLFAFGGMADSHVSSAELTAWQVLTNKRFAVQLFPGDHFYLNHEPQPLLHAIGQIFTAFGTSMP